jgi:hypothetical protein
MFKVSFFNSVCYLAVKYAVFFFVLAFMENRFKDIVINNAETTTELIKLTLGYILYVLFHMLLLILIFSIPLYFIMKIRSMVCFVLLMIVFFAVEYFVYTWGTSQKYFYDMNGIYNLIIGIIVFVLFYYKSLIQIFK